MNTEMDATPPAGYVGCPKECGRYCPPMPKQAMCWSCWDGYKLPNKAEAPGARLSHPDWQPPIPAPQQKIEVKTTVDGKCPLCGVAVPSTHIHFCSPQHVERRKGQTYRRPGGRVSTIVAAIDDHTWQFSPPDPNGACKASESWVASNWTLVADAPPEPGKPTTPQCASSCRPGMRCKYCMTEVATKAPPAHEAPKAAPVVVCIDCDTAPIAHPVPMRFVGLVHRARPICDDCYLARETHIGDHDYTPYKGPERLRNVLARDELVEWDCLEDA